MKDDRNIVDKRLEIGRCDSQIWQGDVAFDGYDLLQCAWVVFLDLIENLVWTVGEKERDD